MVQFRFLFRATLAAMAAAILLPTMLVRAWQMKQAPLMTDWAAQVDPNNPWPEYPRPQMVRTNWLNLNRLLKYGYFFSSRRFLTSEFFKIGCGNRGNI